MPVPHPVSVTAWITHEDDQALDDLLANYIRASRHLISVAVVRAGLRQLRKHPEMVMDLLGDQPRAKHLRLRRSEP
jgi:hypothetical protein